MTPPCLDRQAGPASCSYAPPAPRSSAALRRQRMGQAPLSHSQQPRTTVHAGQPYSSSSAFTSSESAVLQRPSPGAQQPGRAATERVGVLLLNLGGPETLGDVREFLYNLFSDDSIIRLPSQARFLQKPLAYLISSLRASKSSEGYRKIGGGSPLRRITEEQAEALQAALRQMGQNAKVYVGMRYWKPFTEDALQQVKQDQITKLVVIPLYPQFSISTSASSLRLFEQMLETDPALQGLSHIVIASWYWRNGYLEAMTGLIAKELQRFEDPQTVQIFFSAHGVPVSYVEQDGDPYKEEMEQCVAMIMARLQKRGFRSPHTLAYQSRVGPVEWLRPYTDDAIRELGQQGVKSLLAVPISFVSEHIETLEEIDMEYRELAEDSGITHWGRVPALNTDPVWIKDLAELVVEQLPSAAPRPDPVADLNLGPPSGSVKELLDIYDRAKRVLPAPVAAWQWGWTKSAETWNGRIAMLAVLTLLLLEVTTGRAILSQWLNLST